MASNILSVMLLPLSLMLLLLASPAASRVHTQFQDGDLTFSDAVYDLDDPCSGTDCGPGRQCLVVDDSPACICTRECSVRYRPVCGSDGMIYPNHCHLHRRACVDARHITQREMRDCLQPVMAGSAGEGGEPVEEKEVVARFQEEEKAAENGEVGEEDEDFWITTDDDDDDGDEGDDGSGDYGDEDDDEGDDDDDPAGGVWSSRQQS